MKSCRQRGGEARLERSGVVDLTLQRFGKEMPQLGSVVPAWKVRIERRVGVRQVLFEEGFQVALGFFSEPSAKM